MGFIIDTPEGIAAYRQIALYHALKLEVMTGMRHSRGSVMQTIRNETGITKRTKAGVLAEYGKLLHEKGVLSHD